MRSFRMEGSIQGQRRNAGIPIIRITIAARVVAKLTVVLVAAANRHLSMSNLDRKKLVKLDNPKIFRCLGLTSSPYP